MILRKWLLTLFNNSTLFLKNLAHILTILFRIKTNIMLELRKRYIALKEKGKQLMMRGEMKLYLELLTEMEQMNLILVKIK